MLRYPLPEAYANAGSKLAACHAKYAFIISLVCFLCKGELNTYGLIGVICNLYFICMSVKFPSVAPLGNIILVSFGSTLSPVVS